MLREDVSTGVVTRKTHRNQPGTYGDTATVFRSQWKHAGTHFHGGNQFLARLFAVFTLSNVRHMRNSQGVREFSNSGRSRDVSQRTTVIT